MGKVKDWVNNYWKVGLTTFIGFLALLILLLIHIKAINPGYNAAELNIHNNLILHNYGFHYLWHNLINFPYTLALVIADKFHLYGLATIRTIGALFGFLAALLFFFIIDQWSGKVAAILGTILFVANFWFLESTRSGQVYSIYPFVVLAIIASIIVFNNLKKKTYSLIPLTIILALSIYVSGMIWFLLIGLILRRVSILEKINKVSKKIKAIGIGSGVLLLLPLIWYIYNSPLTRLKSVAGIPEHFNSMSSYLTSFIEIPLHLFVINNDPCFLTIGRLPMFDVFGLTLFLLGLYRSWIQFRFKRTGLLATGFLISWILTTLGVVPTIIMYPFILIFISFGISYLLAAWYRVFPLNPFARSIGVVILSGAVLILAFYHINQYYIAWPHSATTLSAYSYKIK
jgi:hypothetical protein